MIDLPSPQALSLRRKTGGSTVATYYSLREVRALFLANRVPLERGRRQFNFNDDPAGDGVSRQTQKTNACDTRFVEDQPSLIT